MAIPFGVLISSLLISRLIEANGTRTTIFVFFPMFALIPFLGSFSDGKLVLLITFFCFGATLSAGNVTMNVEADRIEFATDKRMLNKCHGSWGLGFLTASLLGVGAIWLGISPSVHFFLLFVLIVVSSIILVGGLKPSAPRNTGANNDANSKKKPINLPNKATFLVVAFAFTAFWLEGSIRNWGVIYLRDGLGALNWHAAIALPAMVSMQALGRFMADTWISKYGQVIVARVLTVVVLVGLLFVVASQTAIFALIGFSLIGLGISTAVPQSISAVARWGDRPSAESVAAFSMLQTLIAFIAPPVFGFFASWLSLRYAWAVFLPLPFIAIYFAKSLAPRENA
ncbi:MAG: hypothetical protein COB24_00960 [Hyphomicrobiales bacterium]|nr:MAG: hypothetical protein COB24_00960 [Hyphomicrobiales bacterium]